MNLLFRTPTKWEDYRKNKVDQDDENNLRDELNPLSLQLLWS